MSIVPLEAAASSLLFLRTMLRTDSEELSMLNEFVLSLFRNWGQERLGGFTNNIAGEVKALIHSVRCLYSDPDCVGESKGSFKRWMEEDGKGTGIESDIRSVLTLERYKHRVEK